MSLKQQSVHHELILLDNRENIYSSAASALNSGAARATGEYLCFCHQDIRFCKNNDLGEIESVLSQLDNLGVAGMSGMSDEGDTFEQCQRNMIIEHENPPTKWGVSTSRAEPVQTVDECIFIIPKKVFEDHPFDEETCDTWHFYAVDYCLSRKSEGFSNYTIPFTIHHQSAGYSRKFRLNLKTFRYVSEFYRALARILRKHRKNYRIIYTTNGIYRTDIPPIIHDLKRARILFSRYVLNR